MVSIQEAQRIISEQALPQKTLECAVGEALGYFLSEKINSPIDLPSFDNSAMDGYAVCGYAETYQIKGEIAAGETRAFELTEGEAIRIFTGGKVPENTTAVIMQEKTNQIGKLLNVADEVTKGKNIRKKGEEVKTGQAVFEPGQAITPATVSTLSSLGFERVRVYDKPRVSILTTGNELVNAGVPLQEGQIYESNGATLKAALRLFGFDCERNSQVKDNFNAIKWAIGEQLSTNDVLLVTGGISVGEYDYVKKALEENGVEQLFYKVTQKPGKPLYFGKQNNTFVFALPGNPASALTCFYLYVLPFLQRFAGSLRPGLTQLQLPLAHDYVMKSDRPTFFKAVIKDSQVSIMQGQSSAMLHALALGNALVYMEKKEARSKGDLVTCYLL
jgi:molybdopterin molybdotransferase